MATKLKVNYEFVGDSTTPVTRTDSIKHGNDMLNTVINAAVSTANAKADKTYVDTELGKKADKSEVNGKANASDVAALQTAVNGKADSSTVSALSERVSTNETGLAAANTRIDNIVAIPPGSTEGNTELIDIRTGSDGKNYATAGDAVRGQVSDLKSDLSQIAVSATNSESKFDLNYTVDDFEIANPTPIRNLSYENGVITYENYADYTITINGIICKKNVLKTKLSGGYLVLAKGYSELASSTYFLIVNLGSKIGKLFSTPMMAADTIREYSNISLDIPTADTYDITMFNNGTYTTLIINGREYTINFKNIPMIEGRGSDIGYFNESCIGNGISGITKGWHTWNIELGSDAITKSYDAELVNANIKAMLDYNKKLSASDFVTLGDASISYNEDILNITNNYSDHSKSVGVECTSKFFKISGMSGFLMIATGINVYDGSDMKLLINFGSQLGYFYKCALGTTSNSKLSAPRLNIPTATKYDITVINNGTYVTLIVNGETFDIDVRKYRIHEGNATYYDTFTTPCIGIVSQGPASQSFTFDTKSSFGKNLNIDELSAISLILST